MSKSHKGSRLSLEKQLIHAEPSTSFLAHYDITENCVLKGTEPISNVSTIRKYEGKFGGGVAVEEGTTNLIPEKKNMYPSYGNTHRTYNTNQYNSNTDFSIGVIGSVSGNIVTLSSVDRVIYTYDVLNPATTGGGVTAGTNYFIKKHSPTTFSVHQYDSSQDGSKGFSVHDSVNNDIRIDISETDFPTMWHGSAHKPNAGLVKEIIPNGFSSNGEIHDCLRLHTEHRLENGGGTDYMAYGVYPQVVSGNTYTFSFYYRAVTDRTIGTNIRLGLHTGMGWSGDNINKEITSMDWDRYEMTVVAPNNGGTNLYFNQERGSTIDISEIQCEEKSFATSFTNSSRASGILEYPQDIIDFTEGTLSCWAKTRISSSSRYIFKQWDTTGGSAGHFSLYMQSNGTIRFEYGSENIISPQSYDDGKHHFYCVTWLDGTDKIHMYVDGKLVASSSSVKTMQNTGGRKHGTIPIGHRGWTYRDSWWNGIIDEVRIDKVQRSDEEIESWYISQLPFSPKGIYRLAY